MELSYCSEEIKRILSSRSYGQLVHEFVHFAVAVEWHASLQGSSGSGRAPWGLLHFLTCQTASRKTAMQQRFGKLAASPSFSLEYTQGAHADIPQDLGDGALVLRYRTGASRTDSTTFIIFGTRIKLLCELADALVMVFGLRHDQLLGELRQAVDSGPSVESVRELTNRLNRKIYRFLGDEIGVSPVQAQKNYRFIKAWLNTTGRGNSVTDEIILEFWMENCVADREAGQGLDFITFTKVADSFIDFLAVNASEYLEGAEILDIDIGNDEAGSFLEQAMFDARVEDMYDSHDEHLMECFQLTQTSGIKAVNKKESAQLFPVLSMGRAVFALPLTAARKVLIGGLQHRITEALRRKDNIAGFIESPDMGGYDFYLTSSAELLAALELTLLAMAHALLAMEEVVGLTLLLRRFPELSLLSINDQEQREFSEWTAQEAATVARAIFDTLAERRLQNPQLNTALRKADEAWRKVNRKGFVEQLRPMDERKPEFELLAGAMITICDCFSRFSKALNDQITKEGGIAAKNVADLRIVQLTLAKIYGGRT